MHPLVDPWMCPDWRLNLQSWCMRFSKCWFSLFERRGAAASEMLTQALGNLQAQRECKSAEIY